MRYSLYFAALLSLWHSFNVVASDCSTIDNSSHFGAVRDQGSVGWCYAFASADLIGEKLNIKPPEEVSAFDLAIGYYAVNRKEADQKIQQLDFAKYQSAKAIRTSLGKAVQSIENYNRLHQSGKTLEARSGGYFAEAIGSYNLRGGYCLESQLPSQDLRYGSYGKRSPLFNQASSNPFSNPMDSHDFILRQIQRMEHERGVSFIRSEVCSNQQTSSIQATLEPIFTPIVDLAVKSVSEAANRQCDPRRQMAPLISEVSRTKTLEELKLQLTTEKSVGITFDSCAVTKTRRNQDPRSSDCSHASVVIGRKKDPHTGECLYKIRNSWGTDCSLYSEDIQSTCDKGNFWLPESKLEPLLQEVVWIDSSN